MVCTTTLFAVRCDTGAAFCSGRAPTPQKDEEDFRSLSFTDNVPFGDTLRAEGYSYFVILLYTYPPPNASVCINFYAYFFYRLRKISVWA